MFLSGDRHQFFSVARDLLIRFLFCSAVVHQEMFLSGQSEAHTFCRARCNVFEGHEEPSRVLDLEKGLYLSQPDGGPFWWPRRESWHTARHDQDHAVGRV